MNLLKDMICDEVIQKVNIFGILVKVAILSKTVRKEGFVFRTTFLISPLPAARLSVEVNHMLTIRIIPVSGLVD